MRKSLGFYKDAREAFEEGLVPEVLNGERDGNTLTEGEHFFAGLEVARQMGMHSPMVMWLFATNRRFIIWQHKSIGSIDELFLSDCESIDFAKIHQMKVDVMKLFKALPFMPFEEMQITGEVNHIVRNGDNGKIETWYLRGMRSFTADRLSRFIADALSNAGVKTHSVIKSVKPYEKAVAWVFLLSLLGLFVGVPALLISENLIQNQEIDAPSTEP